MVGRIAGDTLSWVFDITNPMLMELEFEAKVQGDQLTGQVKLGMFGNASLAGERASTRVWFRGHHTYPPPGKRSTGDQYRVPETHSVAAADGAGRYRWDIVLMDG